MCSNRPQDKLLCDTFCTEFMKVRDQLALCCQRNQSQSVVFFYSTHKHVIRGWNTSDSSDLEIKAGFH